MQRLGLVGLMFGAFLVFLSAPQELAAQSHPILVPPNPDNGGGSGGRPIPGRPPQPKPNSPEVFYCITPDTSCRTSQETFSLAELRDLFVFVTWPGVSGQHVQTLQFFQPDGNVYSATKTRFAVGGGAAAAAAAPLAAVAPAPATGNVVAPLPPAPHLMLNANVVHSEGIPSLLMKSRGDSAVLTVLPVAGTYITQRNFSGTWQVRVLLDDKFVLESAFTLTPAPPPAKAEEETER
jgi:hypothetical protein